MNYRSEYDKQPVFTRNQVTDAEKMYGTQRVNGSLKRPRPASTDTNNQTRLKTNVSRLLRLKSEYESRRKKLISNSQCRTEANIRNKYTIPFENNIRDSLGLREGETSPEFERQKKYFHEQWLRLRFGNRTAIDINNAKLENLNKEQLQIESQPLSKVHEILFSNPNLVFNIPPGMLPKLHFNYANRRDSRGHLLHEPNRFNPASLRTMTKELKGDRARWRNIVKRLQGVKTFWRIPTQVGSSNSNRIAIGQEKTLPNTKYGASGRPSLVKTNVKSVGAMLKRRQRDQVTLYHTVARSQNIGNVLASIKQLAKSINGSIGEFGKSYWHTDPMFQWVGSAHESHGNKPSPSVVALFTMKAPVNEYNKWIRSTKLYNRNSTGTGTTLLLEPFLFRVEKKRLNNHNHGWNGYQQKSLPHFEIQWLSNNSNTSWN